MKRPIHIPVDFILETTHLSWNDMRYGLDRGFIDRRDIISLAINYVSQSEKSCSLEIELAGLLRREESRVVELLDLLISKEKPGCDSKSKWLYLILAWIYKERKSFGDPLEVVEELYADFDYPEEIACFVRYMPPSDGYRPQDHLHDENNQRLLKLWHDYLIFYRPLT